jgi:hypothetical protein
VSTESTRFLSVLQAAILSVAVLLAPGCLAAETAARAVSEPVPERSVVVENVAELLRKGYTTERAGKQLADGLLLQSASLAQVKDPASFVRAMTQAMQALTPDLHLYLSYEPDRQFVPGAAEGANSATDADGKVRAVVRSGRIDGRDQQAVARSNFGYNRAERLAGNIGYLQVSRFVPLAMSRQTAQAAIGFIANSDAVLIDLRGNIGGAPDAVAFLLSHFFGPDAAPQLIHSATNRSQARSDQILTDPAAGHEKLSKLPLYVLIDRQSASAAEMFAYAVQRLGRGTLIGETSSGAGNGGRKFSVGQGFALFLPEWSSTNGPGWEGTGVRPDIAVAQTNDARLAAHRLALQRLAASPGQSAELKVERDRALAIISPQ